MVNKFKNYWRRLSTLPLGKWLFSKALALLIPYTGTISPYVLSISAGYAKVRMADRRLMRNHLGSIHALALANLGELTTGLALHFGIKETDRAILISLNAEYHKKARGVITAVAQIKNLDSNLVGPIEVQAQLFDQNLVLVTSIKAIWLVSEKKVG